MAEAQMVDPHEVEMTGENSFVRLSNDGGKTIADRASHWRVLWSPSGQGHVLSSDSPLKVCSTFLPARAAQLSVSGRAAAAKVFPADRFGKPASSCCLAWSESRTRPKA